MGGRVEINGLFIYTPYAGTPLFEDAKKYGYEPKKGLDGWANWNFSDSRNNPWLSRALRSRLEAISRIARFKFLYARFESSSNEFKREKLKSPIVRIGYNIFVGLFAKMAEWRWRRRYFDLAIEWEIWQSLTRYIFKTR